MPSSFKEFLASRDAPAPAPAPAPTRKKKQAAVAPPAPPVRLPLGFGKQTIAGVEVWYVRPERCTGLLFVAHGMCHGAYDWFRGDEVAGGVGLPEEVAIVRAASARGYAVAAVSSLDRSRKAWSPEADGPRVAAALDALSAALGGRGALRVAAFGASNGGAFVLHLTRFVALDAVCCAIMALAPRELEFLAANPKFPRVAVFDHMPRDARTARAAAANVALLRAAGRAAVELRVAPRAVDGAFLGDRAGLPRGAADDAAAALAAAGLLAADGSLADDPLRSAWRGVLRPVLARHGVADALVADASAVAELMNVAYGEHELAATNIGAILDAFASP